MKLHGQRAHGVAGDDEDAVVVVVEAAIVSSVNTLRAHCRLSPYVLQSDNCRCVRGMLRCAGRSPCVASLLAVTFMSLFLKPAVLARFFATFPRTPLLSVICLSHPRAQHLPLPEVARRRRSACARVLRQATRRGD